MKHTKHSRTLLIAIICVVSVVCVTLFASCGISDPEIFTLSFDLNGGVSEEITDIECEYGSTVDLTKYIPSRNDYIFGGWNYNGETVTELTIENNVTVKAEWKFVYDLAETDGGVTYALTGIKTEYKGQELILPEEYDGKKITEIKAGAFDNAADVNSIVIGNAYTEIESGVLAPLKKIEKITLPFYGTEDNKDYFITLFGSTETPDVATETHYAVTAGGKYYLVPSSLKTLAVTGGDIVPDINKLNIEYFSLSSVQITEIPAYAFYNNQSVEYIDLKDSVNIEKIGDSNFSECENLKVVDLRGLENLKVIGAHAFYYYTSGSEEKHAFEEIYLSGLNSLETIGQMSFWYISAAELDFSETAIVSFGRQTVFHSVVNSVKLPATFNPVISDEESGLLEEKHDLTYLNNSEFLAYCDGLAEITVDQLSLYATIENGVLYDYDKTVAVKYAAESVFETYVAPETLKTVMPTAFENATNLKNIDLSESMVKTIGYNAFGGCSAKLIVGFDKFGYYAKDGGKVSLANGWSGNCKVAYGERYLFFTVKETNVSDGLEVVDSEYNFDITATYGDDIATVTVTFNGETITRGENGYTVTLSAGENTITAVATFGDKTSEVKTYTVTLNEAWTVKTDFEDGKKIAWAAGNLKFVVTALNAKGEKQPITDVHIELDCGYSASFVTPFTGVSVVYNADGTATVTVNPDDLLTWDYDVTKSHHMRIVVKQSASISVSVTYDAQYFENAPEVTSETPVSGNTASGDEWTFEVCVKSGLTALKISSVKIELKTERVFFENSMILSYESSGDGTTVKIKVDLTVLGGWGYVYDGDSFDVRVTVTTESGLTATQIFTATYNE